MMRVPTHPWSLSRCSRGPVLISLLTSPSPESAAPAALPSPVLGLASYFARMSTTSSQGSALAGTSRRGKVHPWVCAKKRQRAEQTGELINVQCGLLSCLGMFLSNLGPTTPNHKRLSDAG